MRPRLPFALATAFFSCLFAISAYAQEISGPSIAPANLAYVDGSVDVTAGGVTEPADPPQILIEGDAVRTRNGRAEIIFHDGTVLHLSDDTVLEILGDERIRLTEGRLIVRMSDAAARPYVIDSPASSVRLDAHGEYGVTSDPTGRFQLSVTRGAASLLETPEWSLRGGQRVTLAGPGARPLIESFNSARFDAFALWAHDRVSGFASAASAAQLPYELRPYAPVLDDYGRWDYVAPHGYVWFPSVGASWRPYYDGAWSFTRYGWTWHGRDRWAWPTHHYGRWGFNGALWYWIPANVWAPAWVTWSVASGYVSWAPLGWVAGGPSHIWRRGDHPAYRPYYNTWRGWTIVPRDHFAPRRSVRAHALEGERLDPNTRSALLDQAITSRPADVAVPRESVTSPSLRGGIRRAPPIPATRPDILGQPRRRPDNPVYLPPTVRSSGERGTAGRRDPSPRDNQPARGSTGDTRGQAVERRGADRDSSTRPAGSPARPAGSRRAPGGDAPAARPPQTPRESGGAVPRSGASRRKG
jgi:hypothetical protein